MNDNILYCPVGTKVTCVETVPGKLTKGDVFTVDHIKIHSWSSTVFLTELPGIGFNTVLFECPDDTPVYTTWMDDFLAQYI